MDAAREIPSKRRPRGAPADAPLAKRRKSPDAAQDQLPKTTKTAGAPAKTLALSAFHEATLAELRPKYDVLVASVISSTKMSARVGRVLDHLQRKLSHTSEAEDGGNKGLGPIVLLHARPGDVGKMISVAEKAKEVLAGEGATVYQYSHLFEVPPRPAEPTVVEETVLGGAEGGRDAEEEGEASDDGFEKLEIFEKAANPREKARPVKSLGIFLSGNPVLELKGKPGITTQTAGRPPGEA